MSMISCVRALPLSLALFGCSGSHDAPVPEAADATAVVTSPVALGAPQSKNVTPSDEGARLTVVSAEADSGWIEKGFFPDVGALDGKTWGSLTDKGDAATGKIKIVFDVPAGATRLALPVVTGPGEGAKAIHVSDGTTGARFLTLDDPEVIPTWRPYEFSVFPDTKTIVVEASDSGSAWGQWLAFGNAYKVAAQP